MLRGKADYVQRQFLAQGGEDASRTRLQPALSSSCGSNQLTGQKAAVFKDCRDHSGAEPPGNGNRHRTGQASQETAPSPSLAVSNSAPRNPPFSKLVRLEFTHSVPPIREIRISRPPKPGVSVRQPGRTCPTEVTDTKGQNPRQTAADRPERPDGGNGRAGCNARSQVSSDRRKTRKAGSGPDPNRSGSLLCGRLQQDEPQGCLLYTYFDGKSALNYEQVESNVRKACWPSFDWNRAQTCITNRWRFPAPETKCKQDDDNQQSSVRIRMATGGNWFWRALKRFFPGSASREDDEDTGSKVPKQRRIESDVPGECSPAAEKGEQKPEFTISKLLAQGDEYLLFQLTKFYRDRLKHAIKEKVERLGWMLTKQGHFSREENEKVTELTEKGKRTESSRLFLSLVMDKGSRARRVMWESFVKWRTELPKLDRILREIQELGPDPLVYINITQGLSELPSQLIDVQQKHKETLRAQTETLRVKTILMREKVKVFRLYDRCAELTVISTVPDRRLVQNELLARGRHHEELREKHLRRELDKIRTDQLLQSSFSRSESKSRNSAAVSGDPGIGKTTMVQKIVYDWATGKIYQQFQFVFSFKFRDLNSINCRINLKELILDQYPYFGNILREVWKNPEGLLFIFDGLDEFNDTINFADSQRDTESQSTCTDPEFKCKVSDIVYSLIQHKLLPGCSVLVTTRPTELHLLEKANISVWAEILGFVGEECKEYFNRHFEDQTVAAAVFKHVKENEILYTMSYNPSYCWILALALGPFFTQRVRDPQQVPNTITQLYSYYIYNILKNHGREIENPRDVLLRVGQMAFRGVSERKIVFTDGDLINYNLQPSQFLSGFLMELSEREDSAQSVVYTFPHLTIQEFVAAVAQFLNPHPGEILKFLTGAHNTTDGRFEVFLRFVTGLSSPMTARGLEEFLGPFPHQTTCRVIDWVKEEVKRQSRNTWSEAGKRSLLNTLHYLFESQNGGLAQDVLGSVETLSFSGMTLTPIDCAVLSNAIGLCDTIKHLDLTGCHIQCEGIQRLGPGLHKCQELRLGENKLGDSGVKLVSAALRNPECKIQRLWLNRVGLTDSGADDLASALSANPSLTELYLGENSLTDRSIPALRRLILTLPSLKRILLWKNPFSETGRKELRSLREHRPGLTVWI
ncbi:NACHT, LRR and PYD domains-containing protein 3-like [Hypanus sabinus]|uniref:NACHT, LRR and PYD domains-containing protein 3-like n=1 Tax=Hypanus sabinus TaxID=79690 RepID=UPI0028C4AA73|nr:NACHT, LRR and PYD domains-containing protein 3-like [Hypanus sabinus]